MASQKISFLIFIVSLGAQFSSAADSISFNQSLSGDQTTISNGGKFVLGFFSPRGSYAPNSYIGIWHNHDSMQTPLWVANREIPVTDTTASKLKFLDDGNLVLVSQSARQIWSTNLTSISLSSAVVAVLMDSGNLVIRDRSDPNKVLWQSCDCPTDTWLTACYLGLSEKTGVNRRLISWKSLYDPAAGRNAFEAHSGGLFLLSNSSGKYWQSKAPDLPGWWPFHYVPNATVNNSANFPYSLRLLDGVERITLGHSGHLRTFVWEESKQKWLEIQYLRHPCGSFASYKKDASPSCRCLEGFSAASPKDWDSGDTSSGCVRDEHLQCNSDDWFSAMHGMLIYDSPHSVFVDSSDDCQLACLNNCSCVAYSQGGFCSLWYGDLLSMQQFSGGYAGNTIYVRMGPSSPKRNNKVVWKILGPFAGIIAFSVVVVVAIWRCRMQDMTGQRKVREVMLVPFRYKDLQKMTENFSVRLGGGGFGSVFKGMLHDFNVVAVKKLEGVRQGNKQFRSEVSTIGVVQHLNVIRLIGFCSEGKKKLLVYEYMPNGSLDIHLFRNTSVVLNWETRYQIALGTARGLAYLHENCTNCIIHCDIKPENILLDASFVPKVADFGLAKNVGHDFGNALTTMRGTIGYLAPEWFSGKSITAMADVYSYGMVLFEIISGRRNTEKFGNGNYFPVLAAKKVMEGDVLSLLDPRLEGKANLEELGRACKVACWCIQDNETCRFPMGAVVHILEGIVDVSVPPIPNLLQLFAENMESSLADRFNEEGM